jgi:hypothetical protein
VACLKKTATDRRYPQWMSGNLRWNNIVAAIRQVEKNGLKSAPCHEQLQYTQT